MHEVQSPLVVFAGAGISLGAPAGAPLWREIRSETTQQLFTTLIEGNEVWGYSIDFDRMQAVMSAVVTAPEFLFEAARVTIGTERLRENLSSLLAGGSPNTCHRAIARLVSDKKVTAVITTNFDAYIEQALSQAGMDFQLLVGLEQHKKQGEQAVVYKAHGDIGQMESIVFTLKRVLQGSNYAMVRNFRTLCEAQNLLICGYSGYDADVFPLIAKIVEENSKAGYKTWINNPAPLASWGPIRSLVEAGLAMPVFEDSGVFLGKQAFGRPEKQVRPESVNAGIASSIDTFDASFVLAWTFLEGGEPLAAYSLFELCESLALRQQNYTNLTVARAGRAVTCWELGTNGEVEEHWEYCRQAAQHVDMYDLTYRDHLWRWKCAFSHARAMQSEHPEYALSVFEGGTNLPMGLSLEDWDELVKAEAYACKADFFVQKGDVAQGANALEAGIAFAEERGLILLQMQLKQAYSLLLGRVGRENQAQQKRAEVAELEQLCGVPLQRPLRKKPQFRFS